MNYYERHIGDYTKDTGHLSMLEHGAYLVLMDRYYAAEAPIPDEQKYRLARARTREEKAAVDAVLGEFFQLSDGAWRQKRCDEVIADHHAFIANQSAKGKASAAARRLNRSSTTVQPLLNSGTNRTSTESQPPTSHSPLLNPKSPEPASPARPPDPRKAIFDLGVNILGEKKRSLIGKAISEVGETKVAEIIAAMAAKPPVDPGAYFAAAIQPKVREVVC